MLGNDRLYNCITPTAADGIFDSQTHTHTQSFSDTPRSTQRMLGVAVPQIGVGVFHARLFHDRADG